MIAEIIKCSKDKQYFIETYFKIKHPLNGVIPMVLLDPQLEVLRKIGGYRGVINKIETRQVGTTSVFVANALWNTLFHENTHIKLIGKDNDSRKKFMDIFNVAYDNLPAAFKIGYSIKNTHLDSIKNTHLVSFLNENSFEMCVQDRQLTHNDQVSHVISDNFNLYKDDNKSRIATYPARFGFYGIHLT